MMTLNPPDPAGNSDKSLMVGESILLVLAFVFSMVLSDVAFDRFGENFAHTTTSLTISAFIFATTCVLMMAKLGLYHGHGIDAAPHILAIATKASLSVIAGTAAVYVSFAFSPPLRIDVGTVALASTVSLIAILCLRHAVHLSRVRPVKLLILGASANAGRLAAQARQFQKPQVFVVLGFVAIPHQPVSVPSSLVFDLDCNLLRTAQDMKINEIVVAAEGMERGCGIQQLLDCKLSGIAITDQAHFLARCSESQAQAGSSGGYKGQA